MRGKGIKGVGLIDYFAALNSKGGNIIAALLMSYFSSPSVSAPITSREYNNLTLL